MKNAHCETGSCHGSKFCICPCQFCRGSYNENADLVSSNLPCTHHSTHVDTKEQFVARWVLPSDENYDENDPQETVTLTDSMEVCDFCGEVLDMSVGD